MSSPTRAVGLVPHRDRVMAHELARVAATWFRERGVEVRVPAAEAEVAGLTEFGVASGEFAPGLDLVVSLGGDGTMLHAVDLVYPSAVPILGVNVGQLGYLTGVEPDELEPSMPRLLAGDYAVSDRMVLAVTSRQPGPRPVPGSRSTRPRSRSNGAVTSSASTCRSTAARSRRTRPTA